MSRIGNEPIAIPEKVDIKIDNGLVHVKGPLGELKQDVDSSIEVKMEDGEIKLSRTSNNPKVRGLHGLYRSLINNMVVGVTEGFEKRMELVGVGYRVTNTGNLLDISVGYSHPIMFMVPDEVKVTTETNKGETPKIILNSFDKQLLGQVAAKIQAFRKPEPYKGKGILYVGQHIRRKAGKTAAK